MKRRSVDTIDNIIQNSPATNKLNLENEKNLHTEKKNLVQKAILITQENHEFLDDLMWKYRIRSESKMIRILLTIAEQKKRDLDQDIESLLTTSSS